MASGRHYRKRLCARTSFGYPAIATKLMEELPLLVQKCCGRWIKAGAEATNISGHTRNQRQIIGAE